jgi:hypothetical protein
MPPAPVSSLAKLDGKQPRHKKSPQAIPRTKNQKFLISVYPMHNEHKKQNTTRLVQIDGYHIKTC